MENAINERIARAPDFKGDGAAVWVNLDKNGNKYLSVKILNSAVVNCFKNEPKPPVPVAQPEEVTI